MRTFREALDEGIPLLLDGATGTELYKRGLYINRCFEEATLGNRSIVLDLHRDYRRAGADILSTNSWGAGYYKLKAHNLQDQVRRINREAAILAREAARGEASPADSEGEPYVAGSVGPLGARLEPLGAISVEDARAAFREQIGGLVEGGIDLVLLETFFDPAEIAQALAAAREIAPGIPVCACMTIDLEGRLPLGGPVEEALRDLVSLGADAVGLNCSVGPAPMLAAARRLREAVPVPLVAEPNAGLPKEVDGRTIYMSTPEYFAEYATRFLQAGVRIVGGCCGTSPAHIRAMAQSVRQFRAMSGIQGPARGPTHRARVVEVESGDRGRAREEARAEDVRRVPFEEKSAWSRKLAAGGGARSVEILPPSGITIDKFLEGAAALKAAGIDAVNIPDGPRASSRMSAIVSAIMVEQRIGIETILHYTCRDRNLIGMQADLLGAHAIGLRNLLVITGDPPKLGDYPDATGVFDVDSIGLAKVAHCLNGGLDIGNRPLGGPTALSIGVGVNPLHVDFSYEMDRFRRKVEAGAEWAVTQPIFDLGPLERLLEFASREGIRVPIVAGIWPLTSLRSAQFMNNEIPGISIPEYAMRRMAEAPNPRAAREAGVEMARDLRSRLPAEIRGVQISAPFGRVELALRVAGLA
jgi:methionine synthase I (cobalamin-dependent)/5,10-methylenetetrahydrofolate reductase